MGGISFFPQKNTRNLLMDCSKTVNLAPFNQFLDFLAVQDSSKTDIVCLSVGLSIGLSQLTIRA